MPVKILVVDDEPDLQPLITQRFRKRIRGNEFEFVLQKTACRRWTRWSKNRPSTSC